jgi:zinc and cadmium transporter
MHIQLLLTFYCVCVVVSSLLGGLAPQLIQLTHRRMQLMMSLVGGLMLGVALLHLLPHSVREQGSVDRAMLWALFGLLFMFLLIRVFHVHAHEHGDVSDVAGHAHGPHEAHGHSHSHAHDHDHSHAPSSKSTPLAAHDHEHHDCDMQHAPAVEQHHLSWVGLAFGLGLHTLIDGLALGAAVASEAHAAHGWALYGLGTFLAVALHKPLDALSITSLMAAGGWSKQSAWIANIVFSLMCPLGALAFVLGVSRWVDGQALVVGCALAFAAGVFLCISLADLLPEVTFHTHDRFRLTTFLLLGVALAWAIGFLEPAHSHSHRPVKPRLVPPSSMNTTWQPSDNAGAATTPAELSPATSVSR